MRILLTGGAGFIGGHTAEALAAAGHETLALDDLSTGRAQNLTIAPLEHADVRDREAVLAAFRRFRPEAVLHLAAVVSVPRSVAEPLMAHTINVDGLAATLEAARETAVRRFVFASSAAVYGPQPRLPSQEDDPLDPVSPYAAQKAAGELIARAYRAAYGIETVALRYFNVYGERQRADDAYAGVIARFVETLAAGRPATIWGDGSQTRDFIHVADVARANVAALCGPDPGPAPINIGSGAALSVRQLHTLIAGLLGAPDTPTFAPDRAGDVPHSRAAIDRMQQRLGVQPCLSMEDGLARLISWQQQAQA
jgi:UDP-glucose 4-epimerase